MDGYYYLHTNGELIFKKFEPEFDSDFVRKIWSIDTNNRANAWRIILESLALNANIERVKKLSLKWGCDLKDVVEYMKRAISPSNLEIDGLELYLTKIANKNYNEWMDWLASTPKGEEPNWSEMP